MLQQQQQSSNQGVSSSADKNKTNSSENMRATNLDLTNLRLVMGSEQLLKEQSSSVSVSSRGLDMEQEELLLRSSCSSIFDQNPYKEFTSKKFNEIQQKEGLDKLIQEREQVLEERLKVQQKLIVKMFDKQKISPKTFELKKFQLEKWVTKEKKNIQKTKNELEKSWVLTLETIKRTQRDKEFMNKIGKGAPKQKQPSPDHPDDAANKIKIIDEYNVEQGEKEQKPGHPAQQNPEDDRFNIEKIDSDTSEEIDTRHEQQIKRGVE